MRAFDWAASCGAGVLWQRRARWVRDGKFYTSSGVSAGIDMALGFATDRLGREAAQEIATSIEYVWNDDPASSDYLAFYTYDSAASLQAKLDYINEHGLGGLIVWEVHGDSIDGDWPMITRMHNALHP